MAEKGADALVQFGADDVFEFAGLRVGFGIVDGEGVLEEALGEAVAADNVASTTAAHGSKLHFTVSQLQKLQIGHARENPRGGLIRDGGKLASWTGGMKMFRLSRLPFLTTNPNLF